MKRARQLGFEILEGKNVKHFGGAYLKNSNPKGARPISLKRAMHLVMRSLRARGSLSLLRHEKKIQEILKAQGRRFGVKIYRQANAGNHLHLIVLPRSREAFKGFIRAVTGLIARLVLGKERGVAASKTRDKSASEMAKGAGNGSNPQVERFWDKRPFTRIVEWGREFNTICDYLLRNTLEAIEFVPYMPRNHKYRESPA